MNLSRRFEVQAEAWRYLADIADAPDGHLSKDLALELRWRIVQAGIDARLALAKVEAAALAAAPLRRQAQ